MYEGRKGISFSSVSIENTKSEHGSSEVSINFYETAENNSYYPHVHQTKIIMANTELNQSFMSKMARALSPEDLSKMGPGDIKKHFF